MTQTNIKKSQKPIDCDVHFKYRCPDPNCNNEHWLSLKETQTKNFKVVCYCGLVFKPKRIKTIKIVYDKPLIVTENKPIKIFNTSTSIIDSDLQQQCVKKLVHYGFTDAESLILVNKAYTENPTKDIGSLVKYILENINILENTNE